MPESHMISPIAKIFTPFNQKFGIPRQSNLSIATGRIEFEDGFDAWAAIKGIEQHSHLWLIFQFDQNLEQGWKPSVRPPRLGGNEKAGVFATRSSFRPNGLGLSVVKLDEVVEQDGQPILNVSQVDMLNQTPIIDIKPYIPYADAIENATSSFAPEAPKSALTVKFSELAKTQFCELDVLSHEQALIEQVLSQDPRPAYKNKSDDNKSYYLALFTYDIEWQVKDNVCWVNNIKLALAE